jgi:uncharacterized protein YoaH (UPF0181 family)
MQLQSKGAGMFGNMANTDQLTADVVKKTQLLGMPDVDINDPASLRASAAFKAKRGDMAGARHDTTMAQGVERANMNKMTFEQGQQDREDEVASEKIAQVGQDNLADMMEEKGMVAEAAGLRSGSLSSAKAWQVWIALPQQERDEARRQVADATALAQETRAQQQFAWKGDQVSRTEAALAKTEGDEVARRTLRTEYASAPWAADNPMFVDLMNSPTPLNSAQILQATNKAYSESPIGRAESVDAKDAMDSLQAYIGLQHPQNAAGAESAKLDFAEAVKANAGMSASGISTYLQHRVVNDNAKKVGLTSVWTTSTATDRKHVDEVVGEQLEEWMTTSGDGSMIFDGSISPEPAQLEDMKATMADAIQSVVSQGYSTGMANQLVAEKFKEHLTIRSGQNQTTNAIEMNYTISNYLISLRNDTDRNGHISDAEMANGPISTAAASAIMSGVKAP